MSKKFDYRKASPNGTLVIMVGDAPHVADKFDSSFDYAILYPNGQYRRVIILTIEDYNSYKSN